MSNKDRIMELHRQGLSNSDIARQLNCDRRGVDRMIKRHDSPTTELDAVPAGYLLRGTSTLVNKDGQIINQWIKTARDPDQIQAMMEASIRAALADMPPLPPTRPPEATLSDLCTLYTLTDCHVGMLAWGKETGEPWNLDIAERCLIDAFTRLVLSSPPSTQCIVNQLGDFLHFDSMKPITPEHGHLLDADSRFQKMVWVAVRIIRRVIEVALLHHKEVWVKLNEGNHDPSASVWLRVMFAQLYENNPRVHVEQSPLPYVVHQHGKTLLGFHHGHLAKKVNLPQIFSARFRKQWGECPHVYIHTGHLHCVDEKEYPGAIVQQHPTLAAPDAYAARSGYISKRQATAITYHIETGEYCRHTVMPQEE